MCLGLAVLIAACWHNQPGLGKQTFAVNIKIQQNCIFFIPFLRSTALTGSCYISACLKKIYESHTVTLTGTFSPTSLFGKGNDTTFRGA